MQILIVQFCEVLMKYHKVNITKAKIWNIAVTLCILCLLSFTTSCLLPKSNYYPDF